MQGTGLFGWRVLVALAGGIAGEVEETDEDGVGEGLVAQKIDAELSQVPISESDVVDSRKTVFTVSLCPRKAVESLHL